MPDVVTAVAHRPGQLPQCECCPCVTSGPESPYCCLACQARLRPEPSACTYCSEGLPVPTERVSPWQRAQ